MFPDLKAAEPLLDFMHPQWYNVPVEVSDTTKKHLKRVYLCKEEFGKGSSPRYVIAIYHKETSVTVETYPIAAIAIKIFGERLAQFEADAGCLFINGTTPGRWPQDGDPTVQLNSEN